MKRFLLFWIFILMVLAVLAQGQGGRNEANGQARRELNTHVTAAQAMDVGYAFMHTGSGSKRGGTQSGAVRKQSMQLVYTGRATDTLTRATTDCYYVYALQPKGFVIVAADERVNPILGYSYDNDFVVENMPEQVRGWLGGYEKQIKTVIDRDVEPAAETTTRWSRLKSGQPMSNIRNGNSVGPLLTTTWNQGQYYNNLCPADANGPAGHVYTGCVATAMAQIINYHQYPQHGRGTHSYESNYGTLTVNYGSANYDYTNMPDALTYASNTTEVDAVATLMRDCGVAVNMGYAADESSAFDQEARAALINFFRYSPNMSFAEKAYFTNDEWETMLRNDLDAGNPVFYSGRGTGGHSFVCDGYNADGYFSFNFGWGGYCNGWYMTSNVSPGGSTFNGYQSAIFGIVPDSTGNVILGQMTGISTFTVDEPLEFYHLMGHNAYEGSSYSNSCNSTVNFIPANSSNHILVDILDYEDQSLTFYDGNGNVLRNLYGGGSNDLSPVVSSQNTLRIDYSGNLYYAGFNLSISQDNGCRRVSNISSHVDTTTVHLTWTENSGATQWQVEYGVKGFTLGTGSIYNATTSTVTISNLQPLTEYDFYIRSVCDGTHYGPWGKTTLMVEGPFWQDIVTSQPVGYVYDAATNSVQISTAEQLAWWAKTGNGIDGHLAADIDLSGHKWQPTELSGRNFNGHGHVITNLFVIQGSGFFSKCAEGCIIENIGLTNAYVSNNSGAGGLCGELRGTMRNCYVTNSLIYVKNDETIDNSMAGGLVFMNFHGEIINCYVNADVVSYYQGGLLACYSYGTVRNCYATGTLPILSWCYYGSIAAVASGEISRCYSNVANIGFISYQVGLLTITDVSFFESSGNGWSLLTPIVFEDVTANDLLSALNRGVEMYNDSVYNTWMADTGNINGGYPVFGSKYDVQCPSVTDVSIQNVIVNNQHAVIIGWTDNGDALQWLIRYKYHDLPDTVYSYVMSTSNPDTLYGIQLGYEYDFDVRAICGTDHRSGWSSRTEIIDLPYWTDIVVTKPDGYVEDADGNVEIYSAEGLAWFAVIMNGTCHQQYNAFSGKTVTLKSDIDLSGYRWDRIGHDNDWGQGAFCGTFDGQNHRISNIYMNSGTGGLFGGVWNGGVVKNIILEGGSITCGILDDGSFSNAGGYGYSGVLIGRAVHCHEISNCHVSTTVHSRYSVPTGALCGRIYSGNTQGTMVSNCSTSGSVYGGSMCGNLIGYVHGNVVVRNCYATGNVYPASEITGDVNCRGVMIGCFEGGEANNCFSTGIVNNCPPAELNMPDSSCYGKVIGCLGQPIIHYLYGQNMANAGLAEYGLDESTSNSLFNHSENTNTLLNSVSINGTNHSDLLDALNAWVVLQNDTSLRTWVLDTLTGYPVFGDYYVPNCYTPTDLTLSQATEVGNPTIKTRLAWTQRGEPDHWEVLYVASGESVEFGNIISVNNNPCVIVGIPVGQPLDFYVRAICGDADTSRWCGPVTYIPDKLHWTEVVTSQPEGYQEGSDGNVYISSAEGLSWVASMVNRLNGNGYYWFGDIILTADIDLSAYRWTAIGNSWEHACYHSFNGNNHVVSGLYCKESSDYQGLFGIMVDHDIQNLILTQCDVRGAYETGAIVGHINGNIRNCIVNGSVSGGLVGYINHGKIENSCFISKDNKLGYSDGFSVPLLGYGERVNCYVGSSDSSSVSNCYYNNGDEYYSIFSGNGHTWTLNSPLYINGAFHSDLVDALNAWVDANNSEGQYLRWVADSNMVNGGYPVFESVSLPAVIAQDTVVAQGYYSWHGMVFTSDTIVTDTIRTIFGYDSVVTYHIIVTPFPITEIAVDTCSSYTWNGETYHVTGDYVQRFPRINDVDSVVILHLTVNRLTSVDEQRVCGNGGFTWIDGITYTANNNTATYTLQTTDGCDSVVTLHLTINHPTTAIDEQTAYESFTWIDGNTYTESINEPTFILTNAAGCDSVVTLHLLIYPTVATAAVSDIATNWVTCGGNVIHDGGAAVIARGVCWSTSQNPTIANAHTTDDAGMGSFTSNITGLTPNTTYYARAYATNNGGTSYGEEVTFTTADFTPGTFICGDHLVVGNYSYTTYQYGRQCWMTQNMRNVADILQPCPSGWHLPNNDEWNLLGNYLQSSSVGFDNGYYLSAMPWQDGDGTQYTLYTEVLVQSNNVSFFGACEAHDYASQNCITSHYPLSIRCVRNENSTLPTVITGVASDIAATSATCGGNITDDGGAAVTYRGVCWSTSQNPTIANAHTSDGTDTGSFTSNITGLTPNTTYYVRAYATNFEGTSYGQEMSLHTLCDMTVSEFNVTACDGYTWHDTILSESGNYIHTFTNANGCNSVVTLHLTIDCTTYGDTTAVACESFTWYGTIYTQTGDYTRSMTNAAGYDSVVTLHLTIHPTYTVTDTQAICASELPITWNGIQFAEAGTQTVTLQTVNGCDSVVTMILTTLPTTTGIDEQTACRTFRWIDGYTYTESTNEPTFTLTNTMGCDSVVTLHLTINRSSIAFDEQIACESFTWIDGNTYTESTNGPTFTLTNTMGCDSMVVLYLTIGHPTTTIDEQTACESFTWIDGNTYTESTNNPTFTMTNTTGCDSVVTLHLTIYHLPAVTTAPVSNIATNWVSSGGNVIHDSGGAVIARGVCWSTSQNPTIADAHTTDGTGTGTFTSNITGLTPNTTYYVRAYATNNGGTSYGEEMTFTTADFTPETFVCGDNLVVGNYSYTTHQYGSQCWMTQNLRNVADILQPCPSGWHLPNNDEWNILGNYLQSSSIGFDNGYYLNTMPWQDGDGNQYTIFTEACVQSNNVNVSFFGCEAHDYASQNCITNHYPLSIRCVRGENTLSTVITIAASDIAATSSISGGNITDDGGAAVTARGVCWSTSQNPTIADAHTTDGTDMGTFTSNITGLTPNTTYYVRAYATNFEGTSYGQEESFTTPCDTAIYEFNVTTCNGYTWDSSTYTESGDYSRTYTSTYGCDSVVTLHLTVNQATTLDTTAVACGSFTWYGTNYTQTGDYIRSLTNAAGCDSIVTLHLTINPIPEVAISGNTNICPGGGTLLTVTGADSYLWSNGSTNSFIPVNVFGVYSVTGMNATGCSNTTSVTVLVTQPPVITITGETNICAGESTTLYAHGGNTYLWSNGSTDSIMTVNSAGSCQLIGYDENGCSSMVDITINVWQPTTSSFSVTACDNYIWNDMVYTQSGDHTQTFQTVHGCDSIVTLHLTINHATTSDTSAVVCNGFDWYEHMGITTSGNYTHTFTNASGCDSVVTLHLTVNHTTTGDTMAVACGSFTWYGTTYTQTGDYTRSLINAAGCDSIVTLHLTISQIPEVVLNATETSICVGGTATIMAGVSNMYDDNISYSWSDGNYGSSNTLSPTSSGSLAFTVTATDLSSGCTSTDEITITVNDIPETPVVTVDNALIYDGGLVTLSVINPIADAVYTWYRNGDLIAGATNYFLTDYLTTNDGDVAYYSYTVLAQLPMSGCVSDISANTDVTVAPSPTAVVSVEGNTMFCEGASTTLHVDVTPYHPSYTYQWYMDNELIPDATSTDYVVSEPARMTPYSFHVVVSANGGYTGITYAPTITVVPSPTVVASISESSICVGGTATLTATVEGGVAGINGYNFQWFGMEGTSTLVPELVGTDSSYTISGYKPVGSYPYWVMVSSEYGCNVQSGAVILSVVSQPAITITRAVGYDDIVCEGGSTAIQANVTGGYGELSYQWYENGYILADETNQNLAINNLAYGVNDSYTVVVSQTGAGCSNSASADINTLVSIYPSYTVAVSGPNDICEGGDLTMFAEVNNVIPGDMLSYQWHEIMNGHDILIENANSAIYTTDDLQSGSLYEYYVVVNSNLSGCTATSSAHEVNVNALSHTNLYETTCEYYTWNDTIYSESGEYIQTYTNAVGCDSVVTLHLTVNHTTYGNTTATACDSFDWYEHTGITQSCENLTHTFINAAGCDSIVTLHLTVNQTTYGDTAAIVCDSFDWYGMHLAQSGDYYYTLTNVAGCDSVVTLHLTVNQPTIGTDVQTACGSYTWIDGVTYTENNSTATYTLSNAMGCDSIVTLHLTINTATEGDTTAIVCGNFDWYGMHLTQSGEYTHTFTNASGCDSVVALHLTINQPATGTDVQIACGSFTWIDGVTYTESNNTATYTLTNTAGCDSIVTLHLTVNQPVTTTSSAIICDSELPYVWNGVTFNEAGTQNLTLQTVNGCDSMVEMTLTVNPSVTIEAYLTISENDLPFTYGDTTFMPGTVQSGDYIFNFTTADGCDSVIILHLTVETGINDYSLNASMKLYPNPTKDVVNVQLTMNNEQLGDVDIQMFDVYGKMLDVIKLQSGTSLQTQIDLSRYANGVYLIKAIAEGNVLAVRKVVKK